MRKLWFLFRFGNDKKKCATNTAEWELWGFAGKCLTWGGRGELVLDRGVGDGGWWGGISNPPRFSSHPDVTRQSNNIEFSNTIFLQHRKFFFIFQSLWFSTQIYFYIMQLANGNMLSRHWYVYLFLSSVSPYRFNSLTCIEHPVHICRTRRNKIIWDEWSTINNHLRSIDLFRS